MSALQVGQFGWFDLTVPDAESVRAFYEEVVGWTSTPVDMGGYNDHCMIPPGAESPVAGICHARGPNTGIPAQWMLYITVADLDRSLASATARGGAVVTPVREGGGARFAVVRDPAGAVCMLYQPPAEPEQSR